MLTTIIQIVLCGCLGIVTYYIVPAIKMWHDTKLTIAQAEILDYWVTTGVEWARQWMKTASGQDKKDAVMSFVIDKVDEFELPYSEEDIDKAIEAIYGSIKSQLDGGSTAA